MRRIVNRFVVPFVVSCVVVVLVLLGCRTLRSTPIPPNWELPPVALTVRKVATSQPTYVWWEAEQPSATNFPPAERNPFAPANAAEAEVLSAGQWIGVDGARSQPSFLEYQIKVSQAGSYFFYTRKFWQHGPFRWRWDEQPWKTVGKRVYLMDSASLRQFVGANWVGLGQVELTAGTHTLRIELTQRDGPAAFDCFVLTSVPFRPQGTLKPDQRLTADLTGAFLFEPESDGFKPSPIDLRFLNEAFAGEQGWIRAQAGQLLHEKTGRPERFWAVNMGPDLLQMDPALMQSTARFLAKKGVNMVRLHGKLWSEDFRQIEPTTLKQLFAFVAAMKQEGIYTCLSIYFPAWLQLDRSSGFAGYTGQNPYALLFFNQELQQIYYGWWRSLLTSVNPDTGKALRDDPAVAMVELVNEDSYFFWTFDPGKGVPAAQMAQLEQQFSRWLTQKYGSTDKALAVWANSGGGDRSHRNAITFLPLYELLAQRQTRRAQDTATFLMQNQRQFFLEAMQVLRNDLGYRGLIYASNWVTADARILGPLDKYSNTVADLMDRHGYFNPPHQGDRASYTLSPGDTYQDRSALLFTSFDKGQDQDFNLPIMDIHYNDLPSITTEINWTMPNRFRTEFPLLAATYGSLQGSDGFFFFATNQSTWEATLDKFSVATPAILGQFPATALIYRKGLIASGESVVDVTLNLEDLQALEGAPVTAPQNLDTFRASQVQPGQTLQAAHAETLDPLAPLVGQVNLRFATDRAAARQVNLANFIDRSAKTVRSATGQLLWDYQKGLVTVNAPQVQGATGFLRQAGPLKLTDVTLRSDLDYGTWLLVALDDRPLSTSRRMLLQVMSEEQNLNWKTTGYPRKRIKQVGNGAIVVRNLAGTVVLERQDAAALKVTALDFNGYPAGLVGNGSKFELQADRLYYLIERSK